MTTLLSGRKSGIGPSGVQLTSSSGVAQNGIAIYADPLNLSSVWIGNSGFTVNSADLTDGFPIPSGDSIYIPHKYPNEIYIRSDGFTGGTVWWIASDSSVADDFADALLKRSVANVEDDADPNSLAFVILGSTKYAIAGSTWTIKKTDGTTFTTKTLTSNAGGHITGVD